MESLGLVLLGTVAGLCTTLSFVPQVVKAWRESDTQAISLRMYWVSLTAFVLWMVHGFMVGSLPIVVFNAFNVILGGLVLWLTLRGRRAGGTSAPAGPACGTSVPAGPVCGTGAPDASGADGFRAGAPAGSGR